MHPADRPIVRAVMVIGCLTLVGAVTIVGGAIYLTARILGV